MNADSPWITLFDRSSSHASGAKFQLGFVDADDAMVTVRLVALAINAERRITQRGRKARRLIHQWCPWPHFLVGGPGWALCPSPSPGSTLSLEWLGGLKPRTFLCCVVIFEWMWSGPWVYAPYIQLATRWTDVCCHQLPLATASVIFVCVSHVDRSCHADGR
jgi:hypothetical protein